ncbi:MAG: M56 family metallopeptidase [Ruminococcaceae bacterium]|nr:M56 family metallopeptidase [Oscillospiraceae bacterium]
MLQEVFYWIFNMSITAALTGTLITLVRSVKKIPRRLSVFLWVIPFARMVFPVGLNSPYSLMSLLSKTATKFVTVYQPTDDMSFSMMNSVMAADTYFPITYKTNILEDIFNIASVVWLVGALIILLILAVAYSAAFYEIKDSMHLRDNIYLSDKAFSPAVYGIVKPRIILPASYKNRDVELVVLHETMHIQSIDNLWRLSAFAIVAVHWFNPLCWLFLKLLLTDLELSCDERVLAKLDDNNRAREYALALLESKTDRTIFTSAFGGAKIRARIENILSYKKLTIFSTAVFIVFIGIIFHALMTNAG